MLGDSPAPRGGESGLICGRAASAGCVWGPPRGYITGMATAHPTASSAAAPAANRQTRIEKGISLARGPALILGTILLAAGLYFMYKAHTFPRFSNFPNGTAHKDGTFFFGIFGANGWTGLFTAACGGLLLFGAAQHLLAKTMSLIVGCALGAAAVISVISGDVLGLAATNGWTELGWAVCAVILLFNTLLPRRRREVVVSDGTAVAPAAGERRVYREREPVAERDAAATREPMAERDAAATREPVAERDAATTREPVAERDAAATREPGADETAPADGAAEQPTTPLRRA